MDMIKHTAKLTTASALALSCGLASGAVAQDQTWLDLGQITLLGSGFETSVMESPASVTVVE
ncbi:MAG: hypothetical protein CSA68_08905 [Rhodobacterales bacterium]|nr:MAG: hypothetical protein CSA68_08905 [Rhodobacterales bacterium]